jgi:hypothetical protein
MALEDYDWAQSVVEHRAWLQERQKRFEEISPLIAQTFLKILSENTDGIQMLTLIDKVSAELTDNRTIYQNDIDAVFRHLLFTNKVTAGPSYVITQTTPRAQS